MKNIHALLDHDTVPRAAASLWGFDGNDLTHVRNSLNVTYRFESEGEGRYLRLSHTSYHSREQIAVELEFIRLATEEGVPVCQPLPSLSGKLIEVVPAPVGEYYCVVFRQLPGERPTPQTELTQELFTSWGETLALLHRTVDRHDPGPNRLRRSWRDVLSHFASWMPYSEVEGHRELNQIADHLDTLPTDQGDYGLIHGDLHWRNMTWDGHRVYPFDFDDAQYGWYIWDFAAALWSFGHGGMNDVKQYLQQMLEGYRANRSFDDRWIEELPWFLRLRNVELLGWLLAKPEQQQIEENRAPQIDRARELVSQPFSR
jgi:Ser/Thr protein kinase RdoA (MazF antagonist)